MRSQEQDLFTLKNKVIVVTGATGVLGGSFVEAISKQGATVVLIGQNEVLGEERAAFIRSQGGEALFLKANVLLEAELEAAKNKAVEKYGSEFRSHPVGTGPFCFVAWEEGQAIILKKNIHYFEKDEKGKLLPYLDGIKISFLPNGINSIKVV